MSITNLLKAKSEFRKLGVSLFADKVKGGGGGSWRFASEDNLLKTIQSPLTKCGLELVSTIQYQKELGTDVVNVSLYHVETGEKIEAEASLLAVIPRKDKNGNAMYLDAEIERGKQFGYVSRTLSIRLLGLSDIDPEDTQNRPDDLTVEPVDTTAEIARIKKEIDVSNKAQVEANGKYIKELYSYEVDKKKKTALVAYGKELKEIFDALN